MNSENKKVKVPISDKLFLRWKQLHEHGDFQKMAREYNIPVHKFQRAFSSRKAEVSVVRSINIFYNRRERLQDAGLKSLSNIEMT
ncbi:MAG TPA: hypothetical protein PK937_06030 [bacterium]|nr:hypothetical protein [Cyclobacteriaceae bacterium]HNA14770.1 hypothetical protein [Cyclobacteriaceae bacterium]HNH32161.1 hypothetical protein [bacterium]